MRAQFWKYYTNLISSKVMYCFLHTINRSCYKIDQILNIFWKIIIQFFNRRIYLERKPINQIGFFKKLSYIVISKLQNISRSTDKKSTNKIFSLILDWRNQGHCIAYFDAAWMKEKKRRHNSCATTWWHGDFKISCATKC